MSKEWAGMHQRLGEQLASVPAVQRSALAEGGEGPEWTLAHALADIAEASTDYGPALQQLLAATTPTEIEDALFDVREVLRHLTYHLADPPYLRELLEERLAEISE